MIKFLKTNKYELLTTFFIFTNLFPLWFPQWMYYLALVMILYKMTRFEPLKQTPKTGLFWGFIVLLWISSIVGLTIDFRLVIFSFILYLCAPRKSLEWHNYKVRLLYVIFIGFGLATLANFYAKLSGVNMVRTDKYMVAMGRVTEFSGFSTHPMWTSCAAALSAMLFTSLSFRDDRLGAFKRVVYYAMILISLYVTIISASRAAFFLALLCMAIVIKMQVRKLGAMVKCFFLIGVTSLFFAPVLMDNSQAMMNKKNALEVTVENTSRDVLWAQRMAEFESSPIIGIGFAAHGVGADKMVGRFESGGSYVGVLAQAGVIGFIVVFLILGSAMVTPNKIGENPNLILIYASFLFFITHCVVEGYMIQAGWYLCLIMWLVVGVMIEHKQIRSLMIVNNVQK